MLAISECIAGMPRSATGRFLGGVLAERARGISEPLALKVKDGCLLRLSAQASSSAMATICFCSNVPLI